MLLLSQHHDHLARFLSMTVRILENYNKAENRSFKDLNLPFDLIVKQQHMALCNRSLVRFFATRISCSCLDQKKAETKALPKIGSCYYCGEIKVRSTLTLCAGCKMEQYCSKECHRAAWPSHKDECKRAISERAFCVAKAKS